MFAPASTVHATEVAAPVIPPTWRPIYERIESLVVERSAGHDHGTPVAVPVSVTCSDGSIHVLWCERPGLHDAVAGELARQYGRATPRWLIAGALTLVVPVVCPSGWVRTGRTSGWDHPVNDRLRPDELRALDIDSSAAERLSTLGLDADELAFCGASHPFAPSWRVALHVLAHAPAGLTGSAGAAAFEVAPTPWDGAAPTVVYPQMPPRRRPRT